MHDRTGNLQAENCSIGLFRGEQSAHYSHESGGYPNTWRLRGIAVELEKEVGKGLLDLW